MKFFKTFATGETKKKDDAQLNSNRDYDISPLSDDEVDYEAITSIEDEVTRGMDSLYGHQNGVVGERYNSF